MSPAVRSRRERGFTLVELMITVTVMAILMLAAAPSIRLWIFNTRIRTAAEALQNGLRLAQSEAVSQNRQVVFGLMTANPNPAEAAVTVANGRNWIAQTVPNAVEAAAGGGGARFIRGGPLADTTGGVAILGPRVVCFSSLGNLVANAAPADTGAVCTAEAQNYVISHTGGDRPLTVRLSIGGRVRMCDPARTGFSDGC